MAVAAATAASPNVVYTLVRENQQPFVDDALPVPCQNHVLGPPNDPRHSNIQDRAAYGCALLCSRTSNCAAFWSYTSESADGDYGRCCTYCIMVLWYYALQRVHLLLNESSFKRYVNNEAPLTPRLWLGGCSLPSALVLTCAILVAPPHLL